MTVMMQRSFASGEISPALQARTDLVKYATGLRAARNGFIPKNGGFVNRAGTHFIFEPTDTYSRMIPWFSGNGDPNYVLVFGTSKINFLRNGSLVRLTSAPTAWSNAISYSPGNLVSRLGVNYYCIVSHINQQPPNATYWHPLDGDIYSIPITDGVTAFNTQEKIELLKYVQDGYKFFVTDRERMAIVQKDLLPTDMVRAKLLASVAESDWIWRSWQDAFGGGSGFGDPMVDRVTGLVNSGAGGPPAAGWVVTAIGSDLEEGLPSAETTTSTVPSSGTPVTLSWTAVTGARGYNVYRNVQGVFYFEAFVPSNSFVDNGSILITPDNDTPPEERPEFGTANNFPSAIGAYQQRVIVGGFTNYQRQLFFSKIGSRHNFTRRVPAADDDSFSAALAGKEFNRAKHILDLGALLIFGENGEFILNGNSGEPITPGRAAPTQYSYNGSSDVPPLVVNGDAIYVQKNGSIIRAVGFDSLSGGRDGYKDADLTTYADHLFKRRTVVAWAYQRTPDPIVWAVMDDGALISLTFIKEQQVLAWCRHDTKGLVKDVCVIPEDGSDRLYLRVEREIGGVAKQYIERSHIRHFSDIKDAIFMDSSLSYDGRNTGATTMTLSGGTTWAYDETLTLTASAGFFTVGDIGNKIYLTGPNGDVIRFLIEGYTSPTVVTGKPHATVPVSMRNVATSTWSRAVDQVSGLSHLEGEKVSVFGDGQVVASPNNAAYPEITVTGGAITLPGHFAVIHVGLPYITDLETLDIDSSQGESIVDKQKLVSRVSMHVEETRGLFVGGRVPEDDTVDPLEGLFEAKIIEEQDDEPTAMKTGVVEVDIESHWNSNGRVLVRQVDPLPMSILSIAPTGKFPFRG